MIKIAVFCSSGMSSSLLVNKMRKEAEAQELEYEINAYSMGTVAHNGNIADVILLGPMVVPRLNTIKKQCPGKPIGIISMRDYGVMDGNALLKQVAELLE